MLSITIVALAMAGQSRSEFTSDPSAIVRCDECGANLIALDAAIRTLKTSPRTDDREDAAESLRSFNAGCHPEAVAALRGAADLDPKLTVRLKARKSLRRIDQAGPGEAEIVPVRTPGINIRIPIPPIARRFVPRTEVFTPGVHVTVNPRKPIPVAAVRAPIVEVDPIEVIPSPIEVIPAPIEVRPIPIPDRGPTFDPIPLPPDPRLEPLPGPDTGDLPPPDPTPVPRPAPEITSMPARLARPVPSPARRSSAKPVVPTPKPSSRPSPTDPPLEGPAGSNHDA